MAEDYENNPIFDSDIKKLQGPTPAVTFNYEWDLDISKWVPASQPEINVDNLNLNMDMESTNLLLSGISGKLNGLDVDVDLNETNDARIIGFV